MGNNSSTSNFDSTTYLQPGISEREILEIKNLFENLGPEDGRVKVENIKKRYKDSYRKNEMDVIFGNKESVTFNDFCHIMVKEIIDTKRKYKNVEFDGEEQTSFFYFCTPPTDLAKKSRQ